MQEYRPLQMGQRKLTLFFHGSVKYDDEFYSRDIPESKLHCGSKKISNQLVLNQFASPFFMGLIYLYIFHYLHESFGLVVSKDGSRSQGCGFEPRRRCTRWKWFQIIDFLSD